MTNHLSGVLTALATPFDPSGKIDDSALRQLVDRSIDGGVDGVVACGSTGEFAAMSGAERRLVVETVIDQAAGRVPVVAQTGAVSTAEAVELSRHAEAAGASVLMVVAPYYEALSMDETLEYLRTVAAAVDVPIMLYNLPAATGVNLDPDTVGALAREVDNIRYIKDTSADMAQAGQLIHRHGDVISTFVGWDSLLLASITEGAAGVMAGTANVMPAQLVSVHRAVLEGDLARARREWGQVYPLMDAIMCAPFIPAIKAALTAQGFPAGAPRKPFAELDAATAGRIAELVAALPQLSTSAWARRVTVAPLVIPLWADLSAVAVASMQGAIFAARVDNHRLDLLGVGVVGTVTGLGGAFIRDILLNVPPAALSNNWYLPVTVVASLVGMVLVRLITRLEGLWVVLDALTVGLYAAIGMTKALGLGMPVLPASFVGVAAAVGGSALRDMMLGQPVGMLKVGTLYAVAAIAGTAALAIALACGAQVPVAAAVCAVVTTAVRMCAVWFGWALPEQRAWGRKSV